jgi:hypothetical protein
LLLQARTKRARGGFTLRRREQTEPLTHFAAQGGFERGEGRGHQVVLPGDSELGQEFFEAHAGLPEHAAQRAGVQLPVHGHAFQ